MKKQIAAIFLTAAMAIGCVPAMAADNAMETALVSVKDRVDIPAGLNKFESSAYTNEDKTLYSFEWRNDDYTTAISVSADMDGHIESYYYYSESLYGGINAITYKTRDEYYAAAERFLKKAVPELFDEYDRLVPVESNNVIRNNSASFGFERQRNGVPIIGNGAYVEVKYGNGEFMVTDCDIKWDYKTDFANSNHGGIMKPEVYYNEFPLELVYRKPMKYYWGIGDIAEQPELVYRFNDYNAGYISVYSGKAVAPDEDVYYRSYSSAKDGAAVTEDAADVLSPEERTEIDNVSGLKTKEQIIESVNSEGVFGTMPSADNFSSSIYKSDNKYYVRLDCYGKADINDSEPYHISICANGQSGELISYSCYYDYYSDKAEDSEYDNAAEIIDGYLKKNYADKLAECGEGEITKENTYGIEYPRMVNGVKYDDNYIYASYDIKHNVIRYFGCAWDEDTSQFTDPSNAVDAEAAIAKMEEYAPVHEVYVKSEDKFVLCYTSDGARTEINAVTGEKIKPRYDYDEPKTYTYSDISGHWAEEMIKAVSQYGAGLPGSEFKPDAEITQAELLKMLMATGYYSNTDEDAMYKAAEDIISEQEKAPEAAVLREDAFVYVIRLMGFAKIASMNDIFKPGFTDGTDISPEKGGALAILRGYGIVKGDAGTARPKDKLTRAEAAVLVYGYLTTEK